MVMERNLVKVGNREVKKRYIGNKLIFEDLSDKTEILSGTEIYTDKADDSVVHVEVDGASVQDGEPTPDAPVEIHSFYDFDMVSSVSGRNLLFNLKSMETTIDGVTLTYNNGTITLNGTCTASTHFTKSFSADGGIYTLSSNNPEIAPNSGTRIQLYSETIGTLTNYMSTVDDSTTNNLNAGTGVFRIRIENGTTYNNFEFTPKLEKGNIATDWTPAPEDITENDNHTLIDKINLVLSEPLRSAGDVKDRLFRDSDGVWKIERNIANINVSEKTNWSIYRDSSYGPYDKIAFQLGDSLPESKDKTVTNLNSHFIQGLDLETMNGIGNITGATNYSEPSWTYMNLYIVTEMRVVSTVNEFRNFLTNEANQGRPVIHQYAVENPTIEILDQELQDKLNNLRSFRDSNYVYTVLNKTDILPTVAENLKPTLHATFKSKGWYDYYLKTLLK